MHIKYCIIFALDTLLQTALFLFLASSHSLYTVAFSFHNLLVLAVRNASLFILQIHEDVSANSSVSIFLINGNESFLTSSVLVPSKPCLNSQIFSLRSSYQQPMLNFVSRNQLYCILCTSSNFLIL